MRGASRWSWLSPAVGSAGGESGDFLPPMPRRGPIGVRVLVDERRDSDAEPQAEAIHEAARQHLTAARGWAGHVPVMRRLR
jgi:hypothetical protein